MSEKNVSVQVGPGLLGLLGIAFVVLKLTGVIHWSWWWVTLPFWGPVAIVGIILLSVSIAAGSMYFVSFYIEKRKR